MGYITQESQNLCLDFTTLRISINLGSQTIKSKRSRDLYIPITRLIYSLQNSLQTTGSKEKETPLVLNNLIRNTCLAVKLLWSRLMCLMPTIRLIYDSLQIRRGSNLTMVMYFYTSLIVLLHSKVPLISDNFVF